MFDFWVQLVLSFSISLGMILGGSLLGSLGSLLVGGYPATTMLDLAERLKLWAIFASIGGTFSTIKVLENVLSQRHVGGLMQQLGLIIAAFSGAHLGYILVHWMVKS